MTEGFRGRMQPGKKIDAMETDAETVNAVYAKIRQKNHGRHLLYREIEDGKSMWNEKSKMYVSRIGEM